ncbi:MAG: tyrosine-type recombinase/integrase [Oscillospiraceae bacterium]|nr:tyrosine-type recombinase/integrase [Oscillospiraceae bacterium]
MGRPIYTSVFANEMNAYLEYKVSSGFKEKNYWHYLQKFDRFSIEHTLKSLSFTRELAEEWIKKCKDESTLTHYFRINAIKKFLIYMSKKGLDVFITRDIAYKKTQFQPHIYTEDEIKRYFEAVDTFDSNRNNKDKLQHPVLFRILYCCGTRINETLNIRKKDVDLDEGIIKLIETKNGCERYIILGDDLSLLMRKFASKSFYLLNDNDNIFTSNNGGKLSGSTIREHHRLFLKKAGISFLGGGEGPRIQDFRHSFSVYSFKQMLDAGIDMYVALPILSTYLGHKTIFATEHYVRLTMSIFPYIEEKFKDKLDKVFTHMGVDYENN